MAPDSRPFVAYARKGVTSVHLNPVARATGLRRADAKRPAWMLLYALLPLCVTLLAFVDYLLPTGAVRALALGVIVVVIVGLAAVWVCRNRRALSQVLFDSEVNTGPGDLTVEVHNASPRVIHLERRRSRSDD